MTGERRTIVHFTRTRGPHSEPRPVSPAYVREDIEHMRCAGWELVSHEPADETPARHGGHVDV
jgi:hypothetical protein